MERTDNDSWPGRADIESRRDRWFLRSFVRLVDSTVLHCASIARRVGHFLYILLDQVVGYSRMSVDLTKIVDEHLRVDERFDAAASGPAKWALKHSISAHRRLHRQPTVTMKLPLK
jgi:hypothetical protein